MKDTALSENGMGTALVLHGMCELAFSASSNITLCNLALIYINCASDE
jgi:hypothetical protein